ncbi:hypothetical protein SBBP1_940027 [Burkholderiales bacterium]|nr:hypothetical protein SBBP1_940027 [Burkholderiales bacterium]
MFAGLRKPREFGMILSAGPIGADPGLGVGALRACQAPATDSTVLADAEDLRRRLRCTARAECRQADGCAPARCGRAVAAWRRW